MSRWNKEIIGKTKGGPLFCRTCNEKRNRFLRGTLICALCAQKMSEKQKREKARKDMVKV